MKNILITGGTVFVSRYIAEYYVNKGYNVSVLNRGFHAQPKGTTLIKADRLQLGDQLVNYQFDAILDITAYTKEDVKCLLNAVKDVKDYVFLSSSAVYPETLRQPFTEEQKVGRNRYWGDYGVNKYEAEQFLLESVPQAYILRPPYIYGPMNNIYREAFVFDCARQDRPFYLPNDGSMQLQFFYIEDLCRFIDILLEKHPSEHIFNLGNETGITVREWVTMCYQAAGKEAELMNVTAEHDQRNYFSFNNYEYKLDVTKQNKWMPETKPLKEGLVEAYSWYIDHCGEVNHKPYLKYIDENFK
ncbi:NAD-dependent epimerase/dehydratase family protein [Anaerocolumna sp. MB42-C2]|uniref:NAD-dependent epimerase/dehydratase family protein n=1 Tax=Anaerocolumna sp. MB42-C2 TaxID=3070997 RepID=UPI0027E164F7|nr:NAD-dependent epimerase/dehydratase family protein [Anaerocolumna sp. MB42-C2]WMJ86024.1 NAD-dependent epimerase/dehydratase family protein [Anaerocolumna sp. MB42-C2]